MLAVSSWYVLNDNFLTFYQIELGYFNAYGFAAHNTSADAFIHLGDYVRDLA